MAGTEVTSPAWHKSRGLQGLSGETIFQSYEVPLNDEATTKLPEGMVPVAAFLKIPSKTEFKVANERYKNAFGLETPFPVRGICNSNKLDNNLEVEFYLIPDYYKTNIIFHEAVADFKPAGHYSVAVELIDGQILTAMRSSKAEPANLEARILDLIDEVETIVGAVKKSKPNIIEIDIYHLPETGHAVNIANDYAKPAIVRPICVDGLVGRHIGVSGIGY